MPKKIQLTIPKPCHENWDAMTPVDKGKFCGSCQKQVVDFSVMSDRQVAEFFKKPSKGSVCGRFMTDQLDRDIEIPKKRIPWLKYFFTIALPAFFVSVKASASKTQGKIKISKASAADTTRKPIYDDIKMMGMVARPQSIKPFINDTPAEKGEKGRVVDAATGEALAGADIVMHSTIGKEKIIVKADGSFYLNNIRKITIHRIVISMPGYIPMELSFSEFLKLNEGHTVRLVRESVILGEMAVIPVCDKPVIGKPAVEAVIEEVNPMLPNQKNAMTGVLIDEFGNKVAGASVIIKGTRTGVATDMEGAFTINTREGDVLLLTGGIDPKEFVVGKQRHIVIQVKRIVVTGEEIIVVVAGGISVRRDNEIITRGLVVDEYNKPVPYASIETPDKKIIIADEDGYFEIRAKQKNKIKKLVVTAAGFEKKEYLPGDSINDSGKEVICLKPNVTLSEVIIAPGSIMGMIKTNAVKGQVVNVMGGVISRIKIDTTQNSKVQKTSADNEIRLYPNPLSSGSSLTLEWKQSEEGYYNLQLVNTAGQSVYQKEIWIDAEARLLNIDLPAVAAGNYFLVVINKKSGKKFTEKVVVQ